MQSHYNRVKEMMKKIGQETPNQPKELDNKTRLLRARLILEECMETIDALGVSLSVTSTDGMRTEFVQFDDVGLIITHDQDMVEVMDGIADICVVANGTAIAYGVNMEPIQALVDQSNMDKFRGDGYLHESGKWIKPSDWEPPNIGEEIGNQIVAESECCGSEGCCGPEIVSLDNETENE